LDAHIWSAKDIYKKIDGPKASIFSFSARFVTTLQDDGNYLQNATKDRRSENAIANYNDSHVHKHNLVNFG